MTQLASLRADAQPRPLAVDPAGPRLTWAYLSEERGVRQLSARVTVEELDPAGATARTVWRSPAIAGDATETIVPPGVLLPGTGYRWTVESAVNRAPDDSLSASAVFETAPANDLWESSRWITRRRTEYQHDDHRPLPYLRARLTPRGSVVRARLHVTAAGIYRVWLDGEPLGPSALGPGWTDYRTRVPYHTHDVTDRFATGGPVVIGAVVADGWYSGGVGPFHKRQFWGKRPLWRAVLVLDYADGGSERIGTGSEWETSFGPLQSADLLQGEVADLRLGLGDWCGRDAHFGGWDPAVEEDGPAGELVAARIDPAAPFAELAPVSLWESSPGTFVADFGQNFAGHVRLRVPGAPGTIVRLRHGEMLEDGDVYLANLRGARATDTVILGDGEEVFEPEFTLHGFRYVEITGYPGIPAVGDVVGVAVSSIAEGAGVVETGDARLDRLLANIDWSMRSNFIEVPTDCPSRDERMGWTGDAQIFAPTATCLADVERFFGKWLDDILDTALDDGALPDAAPNAGVFDWTDSGSSGYAEAGVIVPWVSYERYGDRRMLERAYDAGARWVDYVRARTDGLLWLRNRNTDYGDWLSPVETPKDLTATAYFARSAQLMARFAEVLDRGEDIERYRRLHADIATAFRRTYASDNGTMHAGTQTAYTLALRFDLLLPEQRPVALAELAADVERRGTPTAGFLAISHLLPVLTEGGRGDLAMRLLRTDAYPSWLYQVAQGATTTWERWDAWRPETGFQDPLMNSFNHFALGSVGDWIFAYIGGIAPAAPGFRRVRIAPMFDDYRSRMSARHRSVQGEISLSWERAGASVDLVIEVPANTTAEVELPLVGLNEGGTPISEVEGVEVLGAEEGTSRFALGSGRYRLTGRVR